MKVHPIFTLWQYPVGNSQLWNKTSCLNSMCIFRLPLKCSTFIYDLYVCVEICLVCLFKMLNVLASCMEWMCVLRLDFRENVCSQCWHKNVLPFMYWLCMCLESTLLSKFLFTMLTWKCFPFMYGLNVCLETSLTSAFLLTILTQIYYTFMYGL